MLVVQETLSPCEVSLEIEVETDKVADAVDRVYREFSQHITVPGFRKGKAPLSFVKQRVSEAQLRERAAEILVEPAYQEAVKQELISPFASPKLELLNLDTHPPQSFKFKAVVPLAPKVEPGPYIGIDIDRVTQTISDEQIDARLTQIQDRAAQFPVITDRPSQVGDLLAVSIAVSLVDGDPVAPRNTVIRLGDPENLPGLTDELVGLVPGDHKHFTLTYPESYPNEEIAGKEAEFHIDVFEIHDRIAPEIDDEFAKTYGKVDTVAELRTLVRSELEQNALDTAQAAFETTLVDKIVAASQIDYPSLLLEQEVNEEIQGILEDLKQKKVSVEDYLTQIGRTPEQLTNEISAKSDIRIRRGLLLDSIARKESLLITDEDIDNEISERAVGANISPEAMRAYIDANKQFALLRNTTQTKKVLSFLVSSAIINDKTLEEVEAANNAVVLDANTDEAPVDKQEVAPANE